MIFMGCIARNFFGKPVEAYNNDWAQWLRSCCLAILLTRGGLQVSFSGKGIIVVFLSFVPQLFEATTLALMGLWAFKFPIDVSFTFGFTISTVAAAIVVPFLLKWDEQGYGRSKGMAASLIAGCTFDNIVCLILFGICKTVAFEHAAENKHLVSKNSNVAWSIGKIFVHNIAGVGLGVVLGSFGWALKFIKHKMIGLWIKCIYCVISAIIIVVAAELTHYTNGKYIACLTLGYTCFRIWGEDKPSVQISQVWILLQPILFGTIGAALLFSQIRSGDVGYAFICIFSGQVMRFVGVLIASSNQPKYTFKERIAMGVSWIPKSAVPATLAGIMLTESTALGPNYLDYQVYGLQIQTTTILAIIICEPLGAFLIDLLVPKFFTKSEQEEKPDPTVAVSIHPLRDDLSEISKRISEAPLETDITVTNLAQNQMTCVTFTDRENASTPVRLRDTAN